MGKAIISHAVKFIREIGYKGLGKTMVTLSNKNTKLANIMKFIIYHFKLYFLIKNILQRSTVTLVPRQVL